MTRIKACNINEFLKKLYYSNYKGSGVDNYIRALKLFLNYAIRQSNFEEEIILEMKKIEDKLVMVRKGQPNK